MLITTLKTGESLRIGDTVVTFLDMREGRYDRHARLGFKADIAIPIDRIEVWHRKRRRREEGGSDAG
jgi:sRNA-binding carbon storage regulator CsrA